MDIALAVQHSIRPHFLTKDHKISENGERIKFWKKIENTNQKYSNVIWPFRIVTNGL